MRTRPYHLILRGFEDDTRARMEALIAVDSASGCWNWTGNLDHAGYGRIGVAGNVGLMTHRVMWTIAVGPVSQALQLDHLCRNRACCNPGHLEPVTARENVSRSMSLPHVIRRTGICARGHELTEDNLQIREGRRRCLTCKRIGDRIRARKYRAQRKAAA